ncbi:DUF4259 domain-containing protein [Streptomyces cyaneofuscatus]|uniref:DUF4259 domain-containing protein n=1 Tax=Streptomyces cyaneofuscatus TaxID=66883 RepID=UPI00342790BF
MAAAALVVAQHPHGEPTRSNYGPSQPLPRLPTNLRTLAVDALDQVVCELSELAELWAEAALARSGDRTSPASATSLALLFRRNGQPSSIPLLGCRRPARAAHCSRHKPESARHRTGRDVRLPVIPR